MMNGGKEIACEYVIDRIYVWCLQCLEHADKKEFTE
jgi:hypothetical protein